MRKKKTKTWLEQIINEEYLVRLKNRWEINAYAKGYTDCQKNKVEAEEAKPLIEKMIKEMEKLSQLTK